MTTGGTTILVGASGSVGAAVRRKWIGPHRLVCLYHSRRPAIGQGSECVVQCDVRDPGMVSQVFGDIVEQHGPPYGLVYAAGVYASSPVPLISPEMWDEQFGVNVRGAVLCVRAVAREMMSAGVGSIVLVGSALWNERSPGLASYCASKAALVAYAQCTAAEFARYGIRVNVVAPGPIDSPSMIGTSRSALESVGERVIGEQLGSPEHVAKVIEFLLHDGQFISGEVIAVDGGWRRLS